MYFEVDYNIFTNKGGMTPTINYITGLYNQVKTLYNNESINTVASEIFVWSTTSPYTGTNSSTMLNQFLAYRNGFNGNIAMLLSYSASGGIAYVNTLCNFNPDYRMGFSSIGSTYSTVPTYSWSVEVVTHEFGHLLGSQHTHACVWNGNNTAIDGCYTTEGGCANPGIPSGGGTIMSYCHLTSTGINFTKGFGTQPGNIIRSKVTAATCLSACPGSPTPTCTDGIQNGQETGVDCGGPSCPPCPTGCTSNSGTLTIILDNYPSETTWNIKNSSNTILYSGGPYTAVGGTVTVPLCLPNGCYTFNIFDSYGDGICCAYGNGSYNVVVNGSSVASGGQFTTSQTKSFCINATSGSSCTDGIKNGQETGVDCGGPTCPPCAATCTDGIQNGQETGVDCGGPSCPPCPTNGETTLGAYYFETGWDSWIDGGDDAVRYSGPRSFEGTWSISLRDNMLAESSMTSPVYAASSYAALKVEFNFYSYSMESGEDFWLQYSNNGGSTWTTVAQWVNGTHFNNNTFYYTTKSINKSVYGFTNNSKFRIVCDASTNSDLVYIDAVKVKGLSTATMPGENTESMVALSSIFEDETDGVKVFPNPVRSELSVLIPAEREGETTVNIYDVMGRKIITRSVGEGEHKVMLDVTGLRTGFYIVSILVDGEVSHTEKVSVITGD